MATDGSSGDVSNKSVEIQLTSDTVVGFIGGGRMAQAMAKGFISSGKPV